MCARTDPSRDRERMLKSTEERRRARKRSPISLRAEISLKNMQVEKRGGARVGVPE